MLNERFPACDFVLPVVQRTAVALHERLVDGDEPGIDVDVGPFQRGQLAKAQAGERSSEHQRAEPDRHGAGKR